MKKNIFFYSGVVALFIVTILLFLAWGNHAVAVQMKEDTGIYEEGSFRQIFDEYDQGENMTVSEFLSQPDTLSKLKSVYATLQSTFGERYIEIGDQDIEYLGLCELDEHFISGGKENRNQNHPQIGIHTPLYSIQIGRQTVKYHQFGEMLENGVMFSKGDYVFRKSNQKIPLIMGNDYQKVFKIGDTFSFSYLGENFIGKVTDFFKKDAMIQIEEDNRVLLNNQIVMPALEIEKKQSKSQFEAMLYLEKTQGDVLYKTREEYQQIEDTIRLIRNDTGILYNTTVDSRIILDENRYTMSCEWAFWMVVGAEVLFVVSLLLIVKFFLVYIKKKNGVKYLIGVPIAFFLVCQLAYRLVLYIPNQAFVWNIMYIRDKVQNQMIIVGAVCEVIIFLQYVREKRKERN